MKLKYIFMLLGAVLLGLTACSKDTPNTPDLSKTLAGTEWEAPFGSLMQVTKR